MDVIPIEFILSRYNYWISIVLMMMGLYIVFSRGNLVKKLVGLNVFQTSVFIFYISIGAISGATAPIFVGGHGGGHGDDHGGHIEERLDEDAPSHATPHAHAQSAPGRADVGAVSNQALSEAEAARIGNALPGENVAAFKDRLGESGHARSVAENAAELHADARLSNSIADLARAARNEASETRNLHAAPELADSHGRAAAHGDDAEDAHGADAHEVQHEEEDELVYANPLPHVLILTAIVVGVATTAVGLSLAVRIREAYGTVEEDELNDLDAEAEFGPQAVEQGLGAPGGAAT